MIHFISDLHLTDEQPHLVELFSCYLNQHAQEVSQLFILGDLFEVWIGDDYQPEWIKATQTALKRLSDRGVQLYFCHGNRDFLVGNTFAEQTGCQLLPEYQKISLGEHQVLLCHGDSLCIDDIPYQEFRTQVRTSEWQTQFLSLNPEQRLKLVNGYRQQSKAANAEKSQDIMDVNLKEVSRVMQKYGLNHLIHGHTHRPHVHHNNSEFRLVLSDWQDHGQFVAFEDGRFTINYFDLNQITESISTTID